MTNTPNLEKEISEAFKDMSLEMALKVSIEALDMAYAVGGKDLFEKQLTTCAEFLAGKSPDKSVKIAREALYKTYMITKLSESEK